MSRSLLHFLSYLIVILSFSGQGTSAFCQPVIQLIEHIGVNSPEVTIGDIAHITECEESQRIEIAKIRLDMLSSLDTQKVISTFNVKQALSRAKIENVVIKGYQSKIYLESRYISHVNIEQLIEDWVKRNAPLGTDAKVRFDQLPAQWKVPAGEDAVLEVHSNRTRLTNNVTLALKATVNRQVMSTVYATVHINLFKESKVLNRAIAKGELITEEDIGLEYVEVGQNRGTEISDKNQVVGKVAKKNLDAGSIVYSQDFELPILIDRGSVNRIVIVNGNVHMNLAGAKAMEAGRKGETVLFSNPLNPKSTLYATVVQPGLAIVEVG